MLQSQHGRLSHGRREAASRAIPPGDRDGAHAQVSIPPGTAQTEGLIGSIIALLGPDLAVPDHTTLSRRAESLDVVRPRSGVGPVHLLLASTGLKICGSGEWLLQKHGRKTRRSWRKLHIAVDADTGQIAAAALTTSDVDDASQVRALLDQVLVPSPRSPRTPLTTRTASMAISRLVIPGRPSSSHHAPAPCRAIQPRQCRQGVIVT